MLDLAQPSWQAVEAELRANRQFWLRSMAGKPLIDGLLARPKASHQGAR